MDFTNPVGSVVLFVFLFVCLQASYLPEDQVPKSHATIYSNVVHIGNITLSKILDNRYLYVGSVNRFFLRDMESDFELKADIPWQPDDSDRDFCKRMHVDTKCHNFIKVIEKNDENDRLLVCGTNAYVPRCRYYDDYTIQNTEEFKETTGLYKSPFSPGSLNTAIFAYGSLYAGTASDAMKSVIARSIENDDSLNTDLKTLDHDSRWLNDPDFISSFDIGEEVLFFLREIAMEYSNYGKVVYSRVAKVCKKDKGGSNHVLENIWTTFLKARIICAFPGKFPFDFNNIQDTFKISYEENGKTTTIFYAVFTTPENAIPGSAICAYNLTDVNAVFNSGCLEKESAKHAWFPAEEDMIPDPRPGTCVDDSTSHSYNDLLFFKSHTLMSDTLTFVSISIVIFFRNEIGIVQNVTNVMECPVEQPPEHKTIFGVKNDYSVECIAITGWVVVAAVIVIFIIGYFYVTKNRKIERQTEGGMKSSVPATTTSMVQTTPVIPKTTNSQNTQEETPLRREKPPESEKPKNYAASINDRRAVNDQRASSLSQNRRSQPHDSFKDVSGELENIHSNSSHIQYGPTSGGEVAHV
uniref:Semaphorin-6A-like n=1 Tax=Saccoglossus kowalevskii TaxID=10224 RepID=A0ABM0M1W0_SACKO|nr:PREDICTED: semaphorin-6A-like [Saccoglossus kowalevskii]